ncbi:MAG: exodeoxyribonuclease VII large subunit [Bacteroidales bacterium]|nr:exodeoxyribonuclease VII large subunit [Bacteroidales bacterium]
MMEQDYLELLELQQIIQEGIEDAVPGIVRVRAEVASIQQRTNGHCYLELCQSDARGIVAKVRAIIWRYKADAVLGRFARETGMPLQAGVALIFEASVNYSEIYGISLIVDAIDVGATLGEAELRRRRTLERLEKEGLLELQKELALPGLPYRLAVISAPDAAGYGDFRRHLLENEYGFAFSVTLFEATMQGDGAPLSIIAALEKIVCLQEISPLASLGRNDKDGSVNDKDGSAEKSPPDAILILRGGGSTLDLACFDDYDLCAAIARCPIPVCTAIGHDRDEHAADLVANVSVKTPTALADLFIDAVAAEDERISGFESRLRIAFSGKIASIEQALAKAEGRIRLALTGKLAAQSAATDKIHHRIVFAFSHLVTAADATLSKLETRITAANPRLLLERGYTLVTGGSGALLRRAADAKAGEQIRVIYPDGSLKCTINETEIN